MTQIKLHNEKDLIGRLNRGSTEAFDALFHAYSSKLYHFAHGYLKSREDAEELVQDVFCKIWERRKEIKKEFLFSSYLFAIAFNQIKKYFRSKARLNSYIESSATTTSDLKVHEDVNYFSLLKVVTQLISQMPERRRMVFQKSRFEGKNAREIAEEMQISQSTVENHLNKALRFLRQHLKDEHLAGLLFFGLFIH